KEIRAHHTSLPHNTHSVSPPFLLAPSAKQNSRTQHHNKGSRSPVQALTPRAPRLSSEHAYLYTRYHLHQTVSSQAPATRHSCPFARHNCPGEYNSSMSAGAHPQLQLFSCLLL